MDKKAENFIRLAENRTNKTIDMMRLIGNLANTSNYSYTEEQVEMIFQTLETELAVQKEKFDKKEEHNKSKFRL